MNLVLNVLIGGVDTTQSQLAHAIRLLAEHPEQWAALARRPGAGRAGGRGGAAVRADHAVHGADHDRGGDVPRRDVPAGHDRDGVRVHRQPRPRREEGDPDEFDIAADRGRARALTFGAGVHYCLGANLARLELREALTFLAERMHGLRLDGEVEYERDHGHCGAPAADRVLRVRLTRVRRLCWRGKPEPVLPSVCRRRRLPQPLV